MYSELLRFETAASNTVWGFGVYFLTIRGRIVGAIISRFEQRGYKLAALKLKQADEALLRQHYK